MKAAAVKPSATVKSLTRLLARLDETAAGPPTDGCKRCEAEIHARAVRTTIAAYQAAAHERAAANGHGVLAQALQIDAARTATKKPRGGSLAAQRARTAKVLALFDDKHPQAGELIGRGLGALVRRGYLKARGDGYVRTAKPYHVTPPRR